MAHQCVSSYLTPPSRATYSCTWWWNFHKQSEAEYQWEKWEANEEQMQKDTLNMRTQDLLQLRSDTILSYQLFKKLKLLGNGPNKHCEAPTSLICYCIRVTQGQKRNTPTYTWDTPGASLFEFTNFLFDLTCLGWMSQFRYNLGCGRASVYTIINLFQGSNELYLKSKESVSLLVSVLLVSKDCVQLVNNRQWNLHIKNKYLCIYTYI